MSRPLAEILLDLSEKRAAWESARRLSNGDRMNQLDDEIDDYREEFRARFKELTGVAWSNVEAAQMSGAL